MGKTQLVVAFCKAHRKDFSSNFWLDSKTEEALKHSFVGVAKQILEENHSSLLQVAIESANVEQIVQQVKR